ncbi:SDR family oxidoreductase [Pedobacter alpinus]|uniref:SDR family oxidoreductase n=1 Tax=Pedobacter alpinus TaxID=1590643 RepID=A0ABW5TUR1_9SPHI
MNKIAIIGATGLIGKPVTQELIAAGFDITIIARDVGKAKLYFPNQKIVYANLDDKKSLIAALKDHQSLYLSIHINQKTNKKEFICETDGLINLLEVAKNIGIKRIAYLSSTIKNFQTRSCSTWWVFAAKQKAVQLIKGSGIPYTIFYPSCFMDSLERNRLLTGGNNINIFGKSNQKIFWISAQDFGKQVVKSFKVLTDENREYQIQGFDAHTYKEAVEVFKSYYIKKPLIIIKMPMGILRLLGKGSTKFNFVYHIAEAINKHPQKFDAQFTWDELGKPTETLKDFTIRIQEKA